MENMVLCRFPDVPSGASHAGVGARLRVISINAFAPGQTKADILALGAKHFVRRSSPCAGSGSMADSMSERLALKNPKRRRGANRQRAGCRQFSRSSLIQINVEVVAMVGTTYLPANAGFNVTTGEQ